MGLINFFENKIESTRKWIESTRMDGEDWTELSRTFFGPAPAPEDVYVHTKRSRREFEQGCTRFFTYTVRKFCEDCEGSGESIKGSSQKCEECPEKSTTMTPYGQMFVQDICNKCYGRGYIIINPCMHCDGKGWTEIQESHDVDIPPHFNEKSITIQGKGHYVDSHTRGALDVIFKDVGKHIATAGRTK